VVQAFVDDAVRDLVNRFEFGINIPVLDDKAAFSFSCWVSWFI